MACVSLKIKTQSFLRAIRLEERQNGKETFGLLMKKRIFLYQLVALAGLGVLLMGCSGAEVDIAGTVEAQVAAKLEQAQGEMAQTIADSVAGSVAATLEAIPTQAPLPSQQPLPTYTPYPSYTPASETDGGAETIEATNTPEPSNTPTITPSPSNTPLPTATSTPRPTATPQVNMSELLLAQMTLLRSKIQDIGGIMDSALRSGQVDCASGVPIYDEVLAYPAFDVSGEMELVKNAYDVYREVLLFFEDRGKDLMGTCRHIIATPEEGNGLSRIPIVQGLNARRAVNQATDMLQPAILSLGGE